MCASSCWRWPQRSLTKFGFINGRASLCYSGARGRSEARKFAIPTNNLGLLAFGDMLGRLFLDMALHQAIFDIICGLNSKCRLTLQVESADGV